MQRGKNETASATRSGFACGKADAGVFGYNTYKIKIYTVT